MAAGSAPDIVTRLIAQFLSLGVRACVRLGEVAGSTLTFWDVKEKFVTSQSASPEPRDSSDPGDIAVPRRPQDHGYVANSLFELKGQQHGHKPIERLAS